MGVPMLIGVDEEGGTVVRVSSNPALCPEPYLSPRQLYEQGGLDLAAGMEQEKIHTLQDLGINVNLPRCAMSPRRRGPLCTTAPWARTPLPPLVM